MDMSAVNRTNTSIVLVKETTLLSLTRTTLSLVGSYAGMSRLLGGCVGLEMLLCPCIWHTRICCRGRVHVTTRTGVEHCERHCATLPHCRSYARYMTLLGKGGRAPYRCPAASRLPPQHRYSRACTDMLTGCQTFSAGAAMYHNSSANAQVLIARSRYRRHLSQQGVSMFGVI
jgi:hypothetical protein